MATVIKYGGNAMVDESVQKAVARTIGRAAREGVDPVVVHGGGPFIEAELARFSVAARFVRGLRVTSPEALGPVERALTLLGKRLAQEIGEAVALTGRDSELLVAEEFDPELGRVGKMTKVNVDLLRRLLSVGVTPVIACLAVDDNGRPLNVNADEVAGAVAGAMASPVVFLTNVAGVLDDPADAGSLVRRLTGQQVAERIANGRISGGMIPKVEAALTALQLGATSALIADGRHPEGLLRALAGDGGTIIAPTSKPS